MFRIRQRRSAATYAHPSTAAVAHVTVATDSHESGAGTSAGTCCVPPPPAPGAQRFTSSVEYAGDGSPRRSSLRSSGESSPAPASPRVTFDDDQSVDRRASTQPDPAHLHPATSAVSASRHSVADAVGLSSDSTDPRASTTSTDPLQAAARSSVQPPPAASTSHSSHGGTELARTSTPDITAPANASSNNTESNVNVNAGGALQQPAARANLFIRLYRAVFRRRRRGRDHEAPTSATRHNANDNSNVASAAGAAWWQHADAASAESQRDVQHSSAGK